MTSWNWRKTIGMGLSTFVLLLGSVSLTGCETGGEELEQEEQLGGEEEEEDD